MLTPASSATSTRRSRFVKSSPSLPKGAVPRLRTETFKPDPPSCLYSIVVFCQESNPGVRRYLNPTERVGNQSQVTTAQRLVDLETLGGRACERAKPRPG